MELSQWNQLSRSSRQAFQWAGALARYRAERAGEDPQSATIGSHDLLVALVLAHPHDSEAATLLEHFGLVLGQVLPPDYPRPAREDLARHLQQVPDDHWLPLDEEDVSDAFYHGLKLGLSSSSEEVAELRAFFAGLLTAPNRAAASLDSLLERRGATLSAIAHSTEEYVSQFDPKRSYRELLQERHPYRPVPVDIPNYKADHASAGVATDLVDIRREVDAFAYLLASRGLQPPLAVGLFGDWGSGKSFFMSAVRERIESLTGSVGGAPQAQVPFWKRVIQIEFNAWHYVEGDLWASLVDHIFSQLKLAGDEDPSLVEQRRNHWLKQLDSTRVQLVRLENQRAHAERELEDTRQQTDTLRRRRDSELSRAEKLKADAVTELVIRQATAEFVDGALEPLRMSLGGHSPDDVRRKLSEARDELLRGGGLWRAVSAEPRHVVLLLLALVAVPALVALLNGLGVSPTASVFGGLSALGATLLGLLTQATQWVNARLNSLQAAEQTVQQDIDQARAAWDQSIQEAERQVADAEVKLSKALKGEEALADRLAEIQREMERVTPERVLNEFIAERVGSGDYRRRLGIPALIQNDFRQLARLVAEQNRQYMKSGESDVEGNANGFNRIILYIDDLDRCPEKHVVEVLQAVHLLLAFELFVVVVAVDSRWLSHALTKHHPALVAERWAPDQATPDDYLEKIFQIPFWIRPLPDPARQRIIRGLLSGHLTRPAARPEQPGAGDRPTIEAAHAEILKTLDPASAPPTLEASALTISNEELAFLDSLAPLLGQTPRAVKRFVNVYQLLRIIHRPGDRAIAAGGPSDHELIAFLLAIGDGLPQLAEHLMRELASDKTGQTLDQLLGSMVTPGYEAERETLADWVKGRPAWRDLPTQRPAELIDVVDRFVFRISPNHRVPPPR